MSQAIRFVMSPNTEIDDEAGYWIIIAAAIVYMGVAVSGATCR